MRFGELHLQLLELHAPPSIAINEEFDIVHMSEHAGRYLKFSGGELTQNVVTMVPEEMRSELRSALYQAVETNNPVSVPGVTLQIGDRRETIDIHVKPVPVGASLPKGFLLVIFEQVQEQIAQKPQVLANDESARHLEQQVTRLKTELRSSTKQHEFATEELKAGNEELQAINEELRSATEEMETSKEELQSINEELSTVNQELKVKVEESNLMSNNLRNIINSTDIGTIILDRAFRLVLYTPAVRNIFNLIPGDQTRPLTDITNRLRDDNLIDYAEKVLESLQGMEREMETTDGHTYLTRISPYRTDEDRIHGVVISFIDITPRKVAEQALRASENHARILADAIPHIVWTNDSKGRANYFNKRWFEYSGLSEEKSIGPGWQTIVHPDDAAKSVDRWAQAFANSNVFDT